MGTALTVSKRRTVETLNCRNVELSDCERFEMSKRPTIATLNCRGVEISKRPTVEMSKCRNVETSNCVCSLTKFHINVISHMYA